MFEGKGVSRSNRSSGQRHRRTRLGRRLRRRGLLRFEALERRDLLAVDLISLAEVSGLSGNAQSLDPSIGSDGRYVAFTSDATNLVAGDTNGRSDVFVQDRQTGLTTLVSVGVSAQANGHSHDPSISADGRYVAFSSDASNLVSGDTNGATDVFVHDRDT